MEDCLLELPVVNDSGWELAFVFPESRVRSQHGKRAQHLTMGIEYQRARCSWHLAKISVLHRSP